MNEGQLGAVEVGVPVMHSIFLDRQQSKMLLRKWRDDYDEDGYDFPFFETWVTRRLKARWGRFDKGAEHPIIITFPDVQTAVEFKLTWL